MGYIAFYSSAEAATGRGRGCDYRKRFPVVIFLHLMCPQPAHRQRRATIFSNSSETDAR